MRNLVFWAPCLALPDRNNTTFCAAGVRSYSQQSDSNAIGGIGTWPISHGAANRFEQLYRCGRRRPHWDDSAG